MIKNFNDFKSDIFLDNERNSMERELRTRKTQRNNTKYSLEINLGLIKRQIIYAIENGTDYVLSVGKRKEELENSTETVFHIEFEDERLGRVRIFKPKDTADKGHYEVNGEYYETCANKVRNFYHLLNQEIKGQPITESLRDKMKPKSEEEVVIAEKEFMNNLIELGVEEAYPKEVVVEFFKAQWNEIKSIYLDRDSFSWSIDDVYDNYRTDLDEWFTIKSHKK